MVASLHGCGPWCSPCLPAPWQPGRMTTCPNNTALCRMISPQPGMLRYARSCAAWHATVCAFMAVRAWLCAPTPSAFSGLSHPCNPIHTERQLSLLLVVKRDFVSCVFILWCLIFMAAGLSGICGHHPHGPSADSHAVVLHSGECSYIRV